MFSLEDDDGDQLFITQSPKESDKGGDSSVLGEGGNFQMPCFSLVDNKYSDISDDDFEIPSSQKRLISDNQDPR